MNDDPTDDAITFEDKGYVRMTVSLNQLTSKFYSATQEKEIDEFTIFSDVNSDGFPIFLWLFFGLLILFGLFLVIYLLRSIMKNNQKRWEKPKEKANDEEYLTIGS